MEIGKKILGVLGIIAIAIAYPIVFSGSLQDYTEETRIYYAVFALLLVLIFGGAYLKDRKRND